jgi:hypothetical protein
MFERYFYLAMKCGARLLFSVAVLLVLLGIIDGIQAVAGSAGSPGDRDRSTWLYQLRSFWIGLPIGWPYLVVEILRGLSSASFPFFGALVVHRIDRWMAGRAP